MARHATPTTRKAFKKAFKTASRNQDKDAIWKLLLQPLSPQQQQVIGILFNDSANVPTFGEIANQFNSTPSDVQTIYNEAIITLRSYCEKNGINPLQALQKLGESRAAETRNLPPKKKTLAPFKKAPSHKKA